MIADFFSTVNGTVSADVNIAPSNVMAFASLNGVDFNDPDFVGASILAGFVGYTKVDPQTGVPTQVDLSSFLGWVATPGFFDSGVDTITFSLMGSGAQAVTAAASFLILFTGSDGTLS